MGELCRLEVRRDLGVKDGEFGCEGTGLSSGKIGGGLRLLEEASGRLRRLYPVAGVRGMGEDGDWEHWWDRCAGICKARQDK